MGSAEVELELGLVLHEANHRRWSLPSELSFTCDFESASLRVLAPIRVGGEGHFSEAVYDACLCVLSKLVLCIFLEEDYSLEVLDRHVVVQLNKGRAQSFVWVGLSAKLCCFGRAAIDVVGTHIFSQGKRLPLQTSNVRES